MPRLLYLAPMALALAPSGVTPKSYFAHSPSTVADIAETGDVLAAPPRLEAGTVIRRADDGLFYVEARVNGAPVQFVVDSGANVVVLSAADAARAGVGAQGGVAGATAGGTTAMRRARIGRVSVAGQTLSDVDAAIVGRDLKVSLLGQSALSQLGAVTFKGDQLEIR